MGSQMAAGSMSSHETTMSVHIDPNTGYFSNIENIRDVEYPMLQGTTYLDHAGTTLYSTSLVDAFTKDLSGNLFGNPHSASAASQLSTQRIEDTRVQVLRLFNANPEEFDVVFVANATAAIKLVADAFRDGPDGFWYGYHGEAHTSLVGVRELAAQGTRCFRGDEDVEAWISQLEAGFLSPGVAVTSTPTPHLFAYPGQSNMTGHKPPFGWCERLRNRKESQFQVYTLYDAAGLLSTSALDLGNPAAAPDFTALSFYKIFGFPDLGALIVRKESGHVLRQRKYFGGGTVDMVMTLEKTWHAKSETSLHKRLEDGTIPFHSIIALQLALSVHSRLYGGMQNICRHSSFLGRTAFDALSKLQHSNGSPVCKIYSTIPNYDDIKSQGPVIAFNLRDAAGRWIGKSEVEKLAIVKGIQLRTGGLCNPGGIANHLDLSFKDMEENFAAGQRCGDEHDILNGKPAGAVRISFGAMSSMRDVTTFLDFLHEFYIARAPISTPRPIARKPDLVRSKPKFIVESLAVFPIKSCAAFKIAPDTPWEVCKEGLAWDREWCLIHQGTRAALSQKRYPRMALLRPAIDLHRQVLRVTHDIEGTSTQLLELGLSDAGSAISRSSTTNSLAASATIPLCDLRSSLTISNVCGDNVSLQIYISTAVSSFFTEALGVPCTLARTPVRGTAPARLARPRMPGTFLRPSTTSTTRLPSGGGGDGRTILLANESPILLISRSSVNRLNEHIKANSNSNNDRTSATAVTAANFGTGTGRAVAADSFRGNIVVAEDVPGGQAEHPYDEDGWHRLRIIPAPGASRKLGLTSPPSRPQAVLSEDQDQDQDRQLTLSVLGPCQRCQMVCVDQASATRHAEPFSTLAKTRRRHGKVWFGMHVGVDHRDHDRDRDHDDGDGDEDGQEDENDDGEGGKPRSSNRRKAAMAPVQRMWIRVGDEVVAEYHELAGEDRDGGTFGDVDAPLKVGGDLQVDDKWLLNLN